MLENKSIIKKFFYSPLEFSNKLVTMKLISLDYIQDLLKIAFEPDIWKYTPTKILNDDDLVYYVHNAIMEHKSEKGAAFVIIDNQTGKIAGSTRISNISLPDKRAEIGWTWLGKDFHGKGFSKASKFELLRFLFEELQFQRVEFKTDVRNLKARKSLLSTGAKEDGILRSHTYLGDNYWRDSIYYSILLKEWNEVKKNNFKEYL